MSKVEFPLNFGYLTGNVFNAFYDEKNNNGAVDKEMNVSMSSITAIKTNDDSINK